MPLSAVTLGLSAGTWSLPRSQELFTVGTYVTVGAVAGVSDQVEVEMFTLAQATPDPLSTIMGGLALSYALVGPVHEPLDEVPGYLNVYVGGGMLVGSGSWGPFIRITPLSIGGPRFLVRERAASIGAFYDVPTHACTIFWNIFIVDLFFRS